MPGPEAAGIQDWLADSDNLRLLLALALATLAALLVALWRTRRSAQASAAAAAGREADLQARLAAEAERLRDQQLAASRLESRAETLGQRAQELVEERDGLSDALHRERQQVSRLDLELAEARLAALKDREAAERDIATLRELREEMTGQFRLMAHETLKSQGSEMQKAHGEQLSALLTPFRDQVHRFQTELQARNKATDEERARLKEQIEYLHKRSEDISREAVALTRALKGDSQKRGAWGEMILERILEDSGLIAGTHYDSQTSHRDGDGKLWRPDVIVKMPQKKLLVIDSKVSLNAYEEAVNAEEMPLRDAALRRHVAAVRAHVAGLAAKGYQALDDGSVDYVLMFIPVEGAFSEALRVDPDLARFAMENRVGLATPTTLMLTLRTVDHIWTVERRESNAMQIAARAGQLYDKLHGFVGAVEEVGVALERAQKSHATALDRLTRGPGNVIRQAEMLRELGARTQKRLALDHDGGGLEAPDEAAE
ncbi:DNA recombination protein RmuC [Paracoccus aminovorans]|uniref:DNA recombination protein RmuC homolog n=1 Tax=Paracoccus aminovorans TaxID=34004 RepID=A0A1I3C3K6_9RHOB|nr:DNA recombination protein RmuC [Paracoccus aminovorans]CQR86431.1 DNA recombination, RmuC [Paracoccus aminovorans]SFH69040.1 DNA recombination protein RmuC [Paracoccus aminovorans]